MTKVRALRDFDFTPIGSITEGQIIDVMDAHAENLETHGFVEFLKGQRDEPVEPTKEEKRAAKAAEKEAARKAAEEAAAAEAAGADGEGSGESGEDNASEGEQGEGESTAEGGEQPPLTSGNSNANAQPQRGTRHRNNRR